MSFICLILSGAALLINGLSLLGRIPARDSGWFNVLIGSTQLILCVAVAVGADGDASVLLSISGTFLFGLTYLYVGLDSLRGLGSVGLGWFSGLVAVLALFYAASSAATDPFLAVLWLTWAALWSLFFLLLAAGRTQLTTFTGWALVLTSQITTTIPALLGLTGHWPVGAPIALATLGVVVAAFAGAAAIARTARRAVAAPSAATA